MPINQKEYREQNREKYQEACKKYRENNKEKIKQLNSQKLTCECGATFRYDGKSKHLKSKSHQEYLNSLVIANGTVEILSCQEI
jgi:hypothetical protein